MTASPDVSNGQQQEGPVTTELFVPERDILRHFLRTGESFPQYGRISIIPADVDPPPVFNTPFYLANIGPDNDPLLLELRFEPVAKPVSAINPDIMVSGPDQNARIALLMTNERSLRDLAAMGRALYRRTNEREIAFDAIVAPESLGSKLAQEVARIAWEEDRREVYITSLQKGKIHGGEDGSPRIGSPKPWVDETAGVAVLSGTSHHGVRQMLYLDQKIAAKIRDCGLRVLVVDDARMTQGTIDASLLLLELARIPIAGVATVLNEADPGMTIGGIPYVWLTKLPLFAPVAGGLIPIPGTYNGLTNFFLETASG